MRALRGLCLVAPAFALALAGCGDASPPNVVLIVVDTLRQDHCSVYGYARDTTPTLRRLAESGTVFRTAYAPMSVTGPSIATLLTGRYPLQHGLVRNGLRLAEEETTLAESLSARGYRTGAVVSSYVLDRRFGFRQGFSHYGDAFDVQDSASGEVSDWQGFEIDGAFDRRAAATTDRAIRWLEDGVFADEPFFLFVHYIDPHSPYRPPAEYEARFPPEPAAGPLAPAIGRYDAEIAYVDAQIDRLSTVLDESGVSDRTLLIVTADHGEGLGDRGYVFHGAFVYDEEVRVPLVVRWPGRVERGRVVEEPVALGDLAPTVLELVGAHAEPGLDGRSLARVLTDGAVPEPARKLFLHRRAYPSGRLGDRIPVAGELFGVREGRWKYVVGPSQGVRELFDLDSDPGETHDLASAEPETVRRLAGAVSSWVAARRPAARPPRQEGESEPEGLRALGYGE